MARTLEKLLLEKLRQRPVESGIEHGNISKMVWNFDRKHQLSRQIQGLSQNQIQIIAQMVKVSSGHIIKFIQCSLVNLNL